MHALQIQNVKRNVVKKISIDNLNKNENEITVPVDKEDLSNTFNDGNHNNNNMNTNDNNIGTEIDAHNVDTNYAEVTV